MIINPRHNTLLDIICDDLLDVGRIPLILLTAIITLSMLILHTNYKSRLLIRQRERLLLEQHELDIEWNKLLLEKSILTDYNRIERIATEKLSMKYVDPLQKTIIVQPSKNDRSNKEP